MRTVFRLVFGLFALWIVGFFAFVLNLPDNDLSAADLLSQTKIDREDTGIVALTGGGGTRIKAAIKLYDARLGKKVFISGVHPDIRMEDISAEIIPERTSLSCCVEIGKKALTTKGNAIETAEWVEENQLETILLVTTDYHMPRSIAEMRTTLPDVKIIAYAVPSSKVDRKSWYRDVNSWRILLTEYAKFSAVTLGQLLSF